MKTIEGLVLRGRRLASLRIVEAGVYANGRRAVAVLDAAGDRLAMVSVNLPDEKIDDAHGWFYAKTWAENAELFDALLRHGVLQIDEQVTVAVNPFGSQAIAAKVKEGWLWPTSSR